MPLQRPDPHKLIQDVLRNGGAALLVGLDELLELADTLLLQLTGEQSAGDIILANLLELVVVVGEEAQVLEGNVDVGVTAQPALLLHCLLAAGEAEFVDLLLATIANHCFPVSNLYRSEINGGMVREGL